MNLFKLYSLRSNQASTKNWIKGRLNYLSYVHLSSCYIIFPQLLFVSVVPCSNYYWQAIYQLVKDMAWCLKALIRQTFKSHLLRQEPCKQICSALITTSTKASFIIHLPHWYGDQSCFVRIMGILRSNFEQIRGAKSVNCWVFRV